MAPPRPRRNYSPSRMAKALFDVSKGMKYKTAATKYNVPRTTLKARYEQKYKKERMGPETTLPYTTERDLVLWITECCKLGFPVTRDQVRDCIKLIITKCNIKSKFKNKRPGYTWLKLFLQRHPAITLRASQVQCKIRKEMTQAKLDFWLQEVKKYIEAEKLEDVIVDGNHIFNCDESAFFLSPSKNQVLAPRSEQRVMSLISNNEKENITALIGSNAMGK